MPISIQTYNNGQGVRTSYSGVVTDEEYFQLVRLYLSMPIEQFRNIRYGLTDLSKVEKLDLSTTAVVEAATMSSKTMKKNPSLRIAIAAPRDLVFGMSKIWSAWSDMELEHTALFRSVAEAEAWLGEQVQALHGDSDLFVNPDSTPAFQLG